MLDRLDELPAFLARGWSFETFPATDPALGPLRSVTSTFAAAGPSWPFIAGGVGRGKTGLAVAVAREFLGVSPARTAFLGRVSPIREELAGERGALLARWLEGVDLLILDDLDFGWLGAGPGDTVRLLAEALQARLGSGRPVVLTAHVQRTALPEQVDPVVRGIVDRAPLADIVLADGPSLRTGRVW